jgi:hypothetical protein
MSLTVIEPKRHIEGLVYINNMVNTIVGYLEKHLAG